MTQLHRVRSEPVQSPLDTYLGEISQTSLLNAANEKELAYRVEDGDCQARDHMVRANLRLVVNIARSYLGKGLELQDLIEEGNLGLLRAVEGFDPSMNTRFSTYASYWIKQSIKRGLHNTAKTIRLPAYMIVLLTKWHRASTKLQEDLGRPPTQDEVACSLHLSRKKLDIIKKAISVNGSALQADQDESGWSLARMLMDGNTKTPETNMIEADDLHQVLDLVNNLDERGATVLRMRFGLDEEEPQSLQKVGEHLGLTRERVRQIEKEMLGQLTKSMQRGAFLPLHHPADAPMLDGVGVPDPPRPAVRRTILVVANLPANLDLARNILEPHGYLVITADGPAQALDLSHAVYCDLILSDVCMSDGSSFDLIRALKADSLLREVPFIFITSTRLEKRKRSKGLALGAAKYLMRPIEPDALLSEIESCLREHATR